MTWEDHLVIMLRSMIGDLDSTDYTDARLRQVLVVAAYQVSQRANITTYNINVSNITISPDPIDSADADYSNLIVYKAACTILTAEAKKAAKNSVSIKDGPSYVDLRGPATNTLALAKSMCEEFDAMLLSFQMDGGINGGGGFGQAILGPYSPGSDLVNWNIGGYRSQNDRYR